MAFPAAFIAIAAIVLAFHVLVCLYVISNPGAVASELAKPSRSFMAWIYLSALSVFRNDPEMDLVQTGLPHDALVANCRRRAMLGLGASIFGMAVVALFILRGPLMWRF